MCYICVGFQNFLTKFDNTFCYTLAPLCIRKCVQFLSLSVAVSVCLSVQLSVNLVAISFLLHNPRATCHRHAQPCNSRATCNLLHAACSGSTDHGVELYGITKGGEGRGREMENGEREMASFVNRYAHIDMISCLSQNVCIS